MGQFTPSVHAFLLLLKSDTILKRLKLTVIVGNNEGAEILYR